MANSAINWSMTLDEALDQRRIDGEVGVRIGGQLRDPVDQLAHRMLAARKEAAIEQRRLDRHHLQAAAAGA